MNLGSHVAQAQAALVLIIRIYSAFNGNKLNCNENKSFEFTEILCVSIENCELGLVTKELEFLKIIIYTLKSIPR